MLSVIATYVSKYITRYVDEQGKTILFRETPQLVTTTRERTSMGSLEVVRFGISQGDNVYSYSLEFCTPEQIRDIAQSIISDPSKEKR